MTGTGTGDFSRALGVVVPVVTGRRAEVSRWTGPVEAAANLPVGHEVVGARGIGPVRQLEDLQRVEEVAEVGLAGGLLRPVPGYQHRKDDDGDEYPQDGAGDHELNGSEPFVVCLLYTSPSPRDGLLS